MENKEIIIIAAIVVLIAIGGVYLYSTNTGQNNATAQNNTTINNTGNHSNKTITNHTHINDTVKTNITAAQAKAIAKQYIEEPGAYPGTPKLVYLKTSGDFKGRYVWEVPIMKNGKVVDGIGIDAQTGENLGEM